MSQVSGVTKIEFIRFDKRAIENLPSGSALLPTNDTTLRSVFELNPFSVVESLSTNVTKTQTKVPGRFVFFEWGRQLPGWELQGTTGNLLLGEDREAIIDIRSHAFSYREALRASKSWKQLNDMRNDMFINYDSSKYLIFMLFGKRMINGNIDSFDFDASVKSPWEWKYTIRFTQLLGLAEALQFSSSFDVSSI